MRACNLTTYARQECKVDVSNLVPYLNMAFMIECEWLAVDLSMDINKYMYWYEIVLCAKKI